MAGWDDIINEIAETKDPADMVRKKYMDKLSELTGRNTIAYYSAWLSCHRGNLDINDLDMSGLMNAIKGMDCSKGLDLILHTPGGSPVAAEAIVRYLRSKFGTDIRVIVPQLAMSAGTMIACSGKEIIMGRHSSLGPIDPQFNGAPAYNIRLEFEQAKEELKTNPDSYYYWKIKLEKYPPAFMKSAIDAIELSSTLVRDWLSTCMFDGTDKETKDIIENIVSSLNEHTNSKLHGRHFDIDFCKNMGLKITDLEEDSELQDAVLSVHHAFMASFSGTGITKIIESNNDKAWISSLPSK